MESNAKYCEVNKNGNLHFAIGTYNQRKIPKSRQHMQKQPLLH
jgi:hypothetical protein